MSYSYYFSFICNFLLYIFNRDIPIFIDATQKRVNGVVKLVLYKGNVIVIGRKSPNSLYDEDLATFESSNYDQRDAEGFIKLNALRLKKNKIKF